MRKSIQFSVIAFCSSISIVAVFLYWIKFHKYGLSASNQNFGDFGSYIGGVVGTSFAIATTILLIVNLRDQQRSTNYLNLDTFNSHFYELLRTHRDRIYNFIYRVDINARVEEKSSLRKLTGANGVRGIYTYLVGLAVIIDKITTERQLKLTESEKFNLTFFLMLYGIKDLKKNLLNIYAGSAEFKDNTDIILTSLNSNIAEGKSKYKFREQQSEVLPLISSIILPFQLITGNEFNEKDKDFYFQVFKFEINSWELFLLYFYFQTVLSEEWKGIGEIFRKYFRLQTLPQIAWQIK